MNPTSNISKAPRYLHEGRFRLERKFFLMDDVAKRLGLAPYDLIYGWLQAEVLDDPSLLTAVLQLSPYGPSAVDIFNQWCDTDGAVVGGQLSEIIDRHIGAYTTIADLDCLVLRDQTCLITLATVITLH